VRERGREGASQTSILNPQFKAVLCLFPSAPGWFMILSLTLLVKTGYLVKQGFPPLSPLPIGISPRDQRSALSRPVSSAFHWPLPLSTRSQSEVTSLWSSRVSHCLSYPHC
jgi:hypothetical protein